MFRGSPPSNEAGNMNSNTVKKQRCIQQGITSTLGLLAQWLGRGGEGRSQRVKVIKIRQDLSCAVPHTLLGYQSKIGIVLYMV